MRTLYNKERDKGGYVNRRNPEQIRLEELRKTREDATRRARESGQEATPADIKERLAQHKYKTAFYAVLRANPGMDKQAAAKRTRELLGLPDPVKRMAARATTTPAKTPILYRHWNAATAAAYNIETSEDATAIQYR